MRARLEIVDIVEDPRDVALLPWFLAGVEVLRGFLEPKRRMQSAF